MRELEQKRTVFSKTYDLGDGKHRLEVGRLPLHFEKDGKLCDIDLTPELEPGRNNYIFKNCPYSLKISGDAPAYAYNSTRGQRVSVELNGDASQAVIDGNLFKWAEVGRDTDYVIQPLPGGCATLLILHTPDAPRRWSWAIKGDMGLIVPLVGRDAAGRRLELIERRDGDAGTIEVEWTGRTIVPRALRKKGGAAWSEDVTYPVLIDPTVNESVGAGTDDAYSIWSNSGASFSLFSASYTGIYVGRNSDRLFYGGVRFQTVAVPNGATINSATLTLRVQSIVGPVNVNVYGNNVNDAATWSDPGNRIKDIAKTTAVVNKSSWSAAADNTVSVTSIVQEIISRPGWASNNDLAFGIFDNQVPGAAFLGIAAFEHPTLAEPRLSIDYSSGTLVSGVANATGTATAIAVGDFSITSDAVMNGAGLAAATAEGGAIADAVMSSAGIATAAAIGEVVTISDSVMSAAGAATAIAVGDSLTAAEGAASSVGIATAIAVGASIASGDASADGVATAIAESEGGLVVEIPFVVTPGAGGGGYLPAGDNRRQRLRQEKRTSKVYTVKTGEWPDEPDLAFIEKQEQEEYSQFISQLPGQDLEIPIDEEEEALMMILALAA